MRRIHKTCDRSTIYKAWLDGLEANRQRHPAYNSSQGEYYIDIVMNLFHCQGGLCAYTEQFLCPNEHYAAACWQGGRYMGPNAVPMQVQFSGQLEHFDKGLKIRKAWKWDNLFMVCSDVNTKVKKSNAVDKILKPDMASYSHAKRLEYDSSKNIFIPNTSLSPDKRARIKIMLDTLGINWGPVREARRIYLAPILKSIEFGVTAWDNTVAEQFPTAFEMIRIEKQT